MTHPDKDFVFPTAEEPVVEQSENVEVTPQTPADDDLDHGLEESFPASDPVSVVTEKVTKED